LREIAEAEIWQRGGSHRQSGHDQALTLECADLSALSSCAAWRACSYLVLTHARRDRSRRTKALTGQRTPKSSAMKKSHSKNTPTERTTGSKTVDRRAFVKLVPSLGAAALAT